jgi:hypothetical protein
MDTLNDQWTAYLNRRTGELFTLTEDDAAALDDTDDSDLPDWQRELLPKIREVTDSEDWLALPSKFDIHEYGIIERFCGSVKDETLREDLFDAIHGGGAFRRFKNMIHRHGIQDDWYRFRERALEAIAVEWLEANEIPYEK